MRQNESLENKQNHILTGKLPSRSGHLPFIWAIQALYILGRNFNGHVGMSAEVSCVKVTVQVPRMMRNYFNDDLTGLKPIVSSKQCCMS